jgi:hypothetical protein
MQKNPKHVFGNWILISDEINIHLTNEARDFLLLGKTFEEEFFCLSSNILSGVVQEIAKDYFVLLCLYQKPKKLIEYKIRFEDIDWFTLKDN